MYEQYGMRPITDGATYGPSYMPLGDSPESFSQFCEQYYTPADYLIARPASFAYRHEIDCLLKFALLARGESFFGIGDIPSAEHAILYAPERAHMLFTESGRCVGWSADEQTQTHPQYSHCKIEFT